MTGRGGAFLVSGLLPDCGKRVGAVSSGHRPGSPLTTARSGVRPYLDTLMALLYSQGNYTATARQLHLSVRAVTYRLDRIRDLTGYHPGEPTQQFTLHAAVLGARLLGWPPPAD